MHNKIVNSHLQGKKKVKELGCNDFTWTELAEVRVQGQAVTVSTKNSSGSFITEYILNESTTLHKRLMPKS
jgi:hypothetical protein